MVVGDCQGCSLPANQRGVNNTEDLKWGDTPISLANYISVLATEYKLLSENNQPVDKTLEELFYAMEAFNRLDYTAETYFKDPAGNKGSPSLNGFFIRGDVPINFICEGHNLPYRPCNPERDFSQLLNSGFPTKRPVKIVISDLFDINKPDEPPIEESHDQVWHMLTAMAIVKKSLPININYQGKVFKDSLTSSFHSEAILITRRMISYLLDNNWAIINPVTGNCVRSVIDKAKCRELTDDCKWDVECGRGAYFLSAGAAFAATEIDPEYNYLSYPNSMAMKVVWSSSFASAFCPSIIEFETLGKHVFIELAACSENYKIHNLAAIGNSWFPLTGGLISAASEEGGFEILPLIFQYLHGGTNHAISDKAYKKLLDLAPIEGPYKFGLLNQEFANFEWSSDNRFFHPERRGNQPNNANASFTGEYNGLDYMLLFNLYNLVRPDYLKDYKSN